MLAFVIFGCKFREELLLLLPGVVVVVGIFATAIVFVVASAASTTVVGGSVASAAAVAITVVVIVAIAVIEKNRGCLGQQQCSLCGKALEAIVVFSVFLSFCQQSNTGWQP